MSATFFIFAAGCTVFALTTLASLWAGYLAMQRAWVDENAELLIEEDNVRPLLSKTYEDGETAPEPNLESPPA